MIQLAIHAVPQPRPHAAGWRATARDKPWASDAARLKRPGHAWPFLSRHSDPPGSPDATAPRAPSMPAAYSGDAS